jgi:hypothetical protein
MPLHRPDQWFFPLLKSCIFSSCDSVLLGVRYKVVVTSAILIDFTRKLKHLTGNFVTHFPSYRHDYSAMN